MKNPDISSLEHTSWRCQYHVVFAPKYRRMEIYREIRADIGVILRKLCQQKGVEIIEANACPDHIHMLISIPPKYSVYRTPCSASCDGSRWYPHDGTCRVGRRSPCVHYRCPESSGKERICGSGKECGGFPCEASLHYT